MKYHGFIGAAPAAVETAAQATAPPPLNGAVYRACLNPQLYQELTPASAFVAGWSNATKLHGSAPLGSPMPAFAKGNPPNGGEGNSFPNPIVNGEQFTCGLAKLQLDFQGKREFPPIRATFLTFRFVPVTATVHLTQLGNQPVIGIAYADEGKPPNTSSAGAYTVVSTSRVSLSLSDVKVNGVSLAVGSHCHTTGTLTSPGNPLGFHGLVLAGGSFVGDPLPPYPFGIGITGGGALAGEATIPPFTGCVTPGGGNLDALLNATVSGPGNLVKVVQGPLCFSAGGGTSFPNCQSSNLVPANEPLWTVTNGGTYTASGPVVIKQFGGNPPSYAVICADSSITGTIPDAAGGPLRNGSLGAVTWSGFSGCTGNQLRPPLMNARVTPDGSRWTVSQQGSGFLDGYAYSPGSDPPVSGVTTTAAVDDVTLRLTGTNVPGAPGGSCTAEISGSISHGSYANSGSQLTVGTLNAGGANMSVTSTNCPSSVFAVSGIGFSDPTVASLCSGHPSTLGASAACPYNLRTGSGRDITITSP